jgi:hypothetical protein
MLEIAIASFCIGGARGMNTYLDDWEARKNDATASLAIALLYVCYVAGFNFDSIASGDFVPEDGFWIEGLATVFTVSALFGGSGLMVGTAVRWHLEGRR